MKLTKDLIFDAKTNNGGFTKAQIEFLGFVFGEEWIDQAVGMELSEAEYKRFMEYCNIDAQQLKQLKMRGEFQSVQCSKAIIYDFNQKGVYAGIDYQDGSPVLVGDIVEFQWNDTVGLVKAEVKFIAPSFVGVVFEHHYTCDLTNASTPVSPFWKKMTNKVLL